MPTYQGALIRISIKSAYFSNSIVNVHIEPNVHMYLVPTYVHIYTMIDKVTFSNLDQTFINCVENNERAITKNVIPFGYSQLKMFCQRGFAV